MTEWPTVRERGWYCVHQPCHLAQVLHQERGETVGQKILRLKSMFVWLMERPVHHPQTGRRHWSHRSLDLRSIQPVQSLLPLLTSTAWIGAIHSHRCGTDPEQASTGLPGVDINLSRQLP